MNTDDMVFVFGSNLSGIHGLGAARYASIHKRAVWGVGEGPTGNAYALPTKGLHITFMNLNEVTIRVDTFLLYASKHRDLKFQVTQVGCGLGGFSKEHIAPLFKYSPDNCYFDTKWKALMPAETGFWGTF